MGGSEGEPPIGTDGLHFPGLQLGNRRCRLKCSCKTCHVWINDKTVKKTFKRPGAILDGLSPSAEFFT
jgi:hypothetical protein